jgi:hypothetical protein
VRVGNTQGITHHRIAPHQQSRQTADHGESQGTLLPIMEPALPEPVRGPLSGRGIGRRAFQQWRAEEPFSLELLHRDGDDVGTCADLGWRHQVLQELAVSAVIGVSDLVIRPGLPSLRECLAEAVHQAFGKGIEGKRVETIGLFGMATAAHARGKVACGVALVADRKNAAGRARHAALKQVSGPLGK